LRAGERWRADVRQATGPIIGETAAQGEIIRIPEGTNEVIYQFQAGKIRRQAAGDPELLLDRVRSSDMARDVRGATVAWQWELELTPMRKEIHLPLRFTFEAATKTTP